jgi:hypothetical protein
MFTALRERMGHMASNISRASGDENGHRSNPWNWRVPRLSSLAPSSKV